MASSATPDLWSDLSGLGSSDASSPDAHTALLKVNASMFVAAPARDRESIETFEALMLGFLPKADHDTLVDLARLLAACEDTPASVLDYLVQHSTAARDIVQRRAAGMLRQPVSRLLATPDGRLQLALQPELDPATVERLLVLHESAVEDALAANPSLTPASAGFDVLLQRARCRPTLARVLLERADLAPMDAASLYLWADCERRHQIRDSVAASLAHRRATISFNLTPRDTAGLLDAAAQGDLRRLEGLLTTVFAFPASTEWRALEIGRHRLLALAFKALGVERKDAIQVFLTLHPALAYPLCAIKELVREMRDVPAPVALALVEAALGVRVLSGETERA
jgi:hypothetical protein